jgi:hypothetical protein
MTINASCFFPTDIPYFLHFPQVPSIFVDMLLTEVNLDPTELAELKEKF